MPDQIILAIVRVKFQDRVILRFILINVIVTPPDAKPDIVETFPVVRAYGVSPSR